MNPSQRPRQGSPRAPVTTKYVRVASARPEYPPPYYVPPYYSPPYAPYYAPSAPPPLTYCPHCFHQITPVQYEYDEGDRHPQVSYRDPVTLAENK